MNSDIEVARMRSAAETERMERNRPKPCALCRIRDKRIAWHKATLDVRDAEIKVLQEENGNLLAKFRLVALGVRSNGKVLDGLPHARGQGGWAGPEPSATRPPALSVSESEA